MSNPVIQVESLGKLYYISGKKPRPPRLRKQIKDRLGNLRQNLRYLRHKGFRAYAHSTFNRLQVNNQPLTETSASATPSGMFWALQDITFEVNQGEVLGIIGRNGAGKSTLLKILSRITQPTAGQAIIHGRIGSLLEVGTGFHEELNGLENIYLNATILGMKRTEIEQRIDDIIAFSGVESFIKTPVKYYSSGMKMRLAFSVAAFIEPEVLLIDEVLAVGDAAFQQKCLQRIEGLTQAGRTVLFVSHSMSSILRFCSRVIWLENGRIAMNGPAQEVTDAYLLSTTDTQSSRYWLTDAEGSPKSQNGTADTETLVAGNEIKNTSSNGNNPVDHNDAPASEHVRLISLRAINENHHTIVSISADQPVGIEIVYDVLKERLLLPVFRFYSAKDIHLFTAVYTDPEYMERIKPVGRYRSIVWIPANFFNLGKIYVSAAMTTPMLKELQRHFVLEKVISFQVNEVPFGIQGASGLYREVPGVIRPKLAWETKPDLMEPSS